MSFIYLALRFWSVKIAWLPLFFTLGDLLLSSPKKLFFMESIGENSLDLVKFWFSESYRIDVVSTFKLTCAPPIAAAVYPIGELTFDFKMPPSGGLSFFILPDPFISAPVSLDFCYRRDFFFIVRTPSSATT